MYKKTTGFTIAIWLIAMTAWAQTQLSGHVTSAAGKEPLAGISIAIKGRMAGTITDSKGDFSLTTNAATPFTISVSGVGFRTQEIQISGSRSDLNIALEEQVLLGQEVVVAASRVEESVMQSPVSIEKMDIRAIQQTPAPSFYDALRNLKGVEMSTQSVTFSNFNTRGFSGNGNVRVVQLTDGMDNQAPGLNFSVANIVGMSELDVESVELLPGAASALYGPNALNGLLLMNSKSPFLYQGLSANAKVGLMNASNRTKRYSDEKLGATPYTDFAIRYAKAFNNKFAFKINAGFLQAQDWQATDYRDQSLVNKSGLGGTRATNPGYDGINIYGDTDPGFTMYQVLGSALQQAGTAGAASPLYPLYAGINQLAGLLGPAAGLSQTQAYGKILNDLYAAPLGFRYTRTGYRERDLVDYNAKSVKLNGSLHYRLSENVEAILQANWGTGTTVYTGADRYFLKGFKIGQYKAELRGTNFFLRAYTTQERAGDAYAVGVAGLGMNNSWVVNQSAAGPVVNTGPTATYFGTYAGTYAAASFPNFAKDLQTRIAGGQNPLAAYQAAVAASLGASAQYLAAVNQTVGNGQVYKPGSAEFEQKLKEVTSKPIPGDANGVGARFLDRSNLYHIEGMYNFNRQLDPKLLEVIVGANYRIYELNSAGTLFYSENGKEPTIKEYGLYTQLQKTIADKLRLTGSIRYDKNENFKGQFNPRLSAVYTVNKSHNLRASYQTGFRIPTTQNQYIDLLTPQARLIGALSPLIKKYNLTSQNAFTLESINAGSPKGYTFPEFKPERVATFEVGYKGLINNRLLVDAYYYNSTYHDFIGSVVLVQPTGASTRNVYSVARNYENPIKTQGFGISVDYALPGNYQIGANLSNNTLNTNGVGLFNNELNSNTLADGFQVGFNTPKYRYNLNIGNRNLGGSGWGFNVVYRYQTAFEWQSSLGNPNINISADPNNRPIIPAYGTLDAQISKRLPAIRSVFKLGGNNILQKEYTTGWGNPTVGSMFYVSLLFDQLMN